MIIFHLQILNGAIKETIHDLFTRKQTPTEANVPAFVVKKKSMIVFQNLVIVKSKTSANILGH